VATKPPPKSGNQAPAKETPRARSFMRDDFPFIKTASLTLLTCVLISAGLVSGSAYIRQSNLNTLAATQPLSEQARDKYTQAANERREIHDFQPKYIQLMKTGFIGEEKRLDWVEGIKRIQEQRSLLSIHYEISPQVGFQEDPTLETGELELRGSKMKFKMLLLHEMDLLNFLDDLKSIQVYSLHDCNVSRIRQAMPERLSPRLDGECSLYWVTLSKRAGAEGADAPAAAQPGAQK